MKAAGDVGDDGFIVMGEIAGPYGVRGEIRVHNYDSLPAELIGVARWWFDDTGAWRAVRVTRARAHGEILVAKVDGIDDRDAASALRKARVALLPSDLPEIEEDSFYWFELIGMAVVNRADESLGRVEGLIESPANDVLRIVDKANKMRLIPMVGSAIDRVDREAKTITVDWGLDWD